MNMIDVVERQYATDSIPDFKPGDTVKVAVKVKEGNRERIQHFQGVVISRKGSGTREMFTVRKISGGIGVERIFPLCSPLLSSVKVVKQGDVRRAKLYYLRHKKGKAAKVKEKDIFRRKEISETSPGSAKA